MSIKDEIYINLAAAIDVYEINKKIYNFGKLNTEFLPSFPEFIVAILRQEIYHSTTEEGGDEWISDIYSVSDSQAGEFFLIGRLKDIYLILK